MTMTPEKKREYMRVWREKNRQKMRDYMTDWREKNREKIREWDKKFYAENIESVRKRQKVYMSKTLDKFAERSAKWSAKNHAGCLLRAARVRASKNGIPFNIDLTDIHIPDVCPVLGIPIVRGKGKKESGSATLDRFDNDLGYVKGNVWVISSKANLMKNNATMKELIAFANWVLSNPNVNFKVS